MRQKSPRTARTQLVENGVEDFPVGILTLAECFLAGASIFIGDEVELGDKLTLGAPDWARDDYAELSAQWEVQRLLWERLWYCADCDTVFDPETHQFEASQDIALLLRT